MVCTAQGTSWVKRQPTRRRRCSAGGRAGTLGARLTDASISADGSLRTITSLLLLSHLLAGLGPGCDPGMAGRLHTRDGDADLRRAGAVAAVEEPPVRCDVTVVAPHGELDVLQADQPTVGGIDAHPATLGSADLHPGMGLADRDGLVAGRPEIAADVPRRPSRMPRQGQEQMGEVLAHTATGL